MLKPEMGERGAHSNVRRYSEQDPEIDLVTTQDEMGGGPCNPGIPPCSPEEPTYRDPGN